MTTAPMKTKTRIKKTVDSSKDLKRMPISDSDQKEKKGLDEKQRLEMISIAAYYIAEKNGFTTELTQMNWILAEKQIDNLTL